MVTANARPESSILSARGDLGVKAGDAKSKIGEVAGEEGLPRGLSVWPGQIRAESQDDSTMVPAAAALMPRYGELLMPVAIIAGTKDRVVDVERHAVRLHNEMPQSTLLLVPDVGHMVHYAVPEQIAEAIETIADQLASIRRTFNDRDCVKGIANVSN